MLWPLITVLADCLSDFSACPPDDVPQWQPSASQPKQEVRQSKEDSPGRAAAPVDMKRLERAIRELNDLAGAAGGRPRACWCRPRI